MEDDLKVLFEIALAASKKSYSPYSKFRVGAAILCADGKVVAGTNVENRSFGMTICAERAAMTAAITQGEKKFIKVVIATPDSDYPVSPCGACRQVLSEFFPPEAVVAFGPTYDACEKTTLGALFPFDALHELAQRNA